ncbi:hypothetical protein N0Y54_01360 [Nostoc punctiforme UO1]|uniref:hypothetical protein n=1 Tax=Nostoc punctiforme TaxID=272131 RepID=UPI0030A219DF
MLLRWTTPRLAMSTLRGCDAQARLAKAGLSVLLISLYPQIFLLRTLSQQAYNVGRQGIRDFGRMSSFIILFYLML